MDINFKDIINNEKISTLIKQADLSLSAIGYTEHSFAHVTRCVEVSSYILTELGYSKKDIELTKIAAYMHDIGNVVNRHDHAQTGALMAMNILNEMNMDIVDVSKIVTAIGNHDEENAFPVNPIAASVIIADKTDVRRSRVRNSKTVDIDIHDRVNYAVFESKVDVDAKKGVINLNLMIDTTICPVMEYFEIFLKRMMLCRKAASALNQKFQLIINGVKLL